MNTRRVSDFETMFRRGLGRAVLHLRASDARPYRDLIVQGCTHNLAHDRQCEDIRSEYLFDIVTATGEAGYYAGALRSLLARPAEEDDGEEDWEQAMQVAALLARAGHGSLRPALYEIFVRNLEAGVFTGAEALVRMDGIVGLDFVAEQTQRRPLDEEDRWQEDALLETFLETVGGPDAQRAALTQARRRSPSLAALLARVQDARDRRDAAWDRRPSRSRLPRDYEEWRAWLADPSSAPFRIGRYTWRKWGREMNADIAVKLAGDLLAEQDPDRLLRYLCVFNERRFPGPFDRLLTLSQEGAATKLSFFACRALSRIAALSVRRCGLDLIARGEWRAGAGLLVRNPAPEDAPLLQNLLENEEQSDEDRHGLGIEVRSYFAANRDAPGAEGPLLALYEHGPCSLCRGHAIDLLQERDPLPGWLREECRYDSYTATRDAVRVRSDNG